MIERPSNGQDKERMFPVDSKLSNFIHSGKMIYRVSEGDYLYTTNDGASMSLKDNLGAINYFFSKELRSEALASNFISTELLDFLHSNISPTSWIIDEGFWKSGAGTSATLDQPSVSEDVQLTLKAKLKKYISQPNPLIQENNWTLVFSVLTYDGAVEKWHFEGSIKPFQIAAFERTVEESRGTFLHITLMQ